jgi:hypothetical protein
MSLNIHGSRLGWMAAGTITICAQASGACAQPTATLLLDLPAQPLEQSLRDVSLRTGISVIAPAELVDGRSAPALRGQHSARSAVDALVAGSGLAVRVVDGALVITAGERAEALAADEAEDVEGQELVVTGTNLRGAEPASPLITITRRDIDRTGATSVDQLLRILPQNTQGGVNKENSNVVLPDQDGTDHGAGLNLRGLGQRATLVLVNGRRLAPSGGGSFVDVSLIPVTALEAGRDPDRRRVRHLRLGRRRRRGQFHPARPFRRGGGERAGRRRDPGRGRAAAGLACRWPRLGERQRPAGIRVPAGK